jgi:hypothetical protein
MFHDLRSWTSCSSRATTDRTSLTPTPLPQIAGSATFAIGAGRHIGTTPRQRLVEI